LFLGAAGNLNVPGNAVFGGCARETLVKGRPSIYSIQLISDEILLAAR
jgi:hypothetical protein